MAMRRSSSNHKEDTVEHWNRIRRRESLTREVVTEIRGLDD